jgi:hypothetical protein
LIADTRAYTVPLTPDRTTAVVEVAVSAIAVDHAAPSLDVST